MRMQCLKYKPLQIENKNKKKLIQKIIMEYSSDADKIKMKRASEKSEMGVSSKRNQKGKADTYTERPAAEQQIPR